MTLKELTELSEELGLYEQEASRGHLLKTCQQLRQQLQAKAEYVENLERERHILLARLKEVMPWVGMCPLQPADIHTMHIVKDLAQDALREIQADIKRGYKKDT